LRFNTQDAITLDNLGNETVFTALAVRCGVHW
jgi:hypothetical protein